MEYEQGQRLTEHLSAGKEEAYKYVFEKYYDMLCLLSLYYVKDRFIAETIAGDVIFKLWENRRSLSLIGDLRKYLIKAVKNRSLNYLDHVRSYNRMKDKLQEIMGSDHNGPHCPIDTLLETELDVRLRASLEEMPVLTRSIFEMSRFENLKYKDISQRVGLSVDTVKYHIKSALRTLRNDIYGLQGNGP